MHAGVLTDPPKSVPSPKGDALDPSNAPSPPEDPPGYLVLSHGLRHLPYNLFIVSILIPSYGTFVRTKGIAPAYLSILMISPSSLQIRSFLAKHPKVHANPFISKISFTETGIPRRGYSLKAAVPCS